MKMLYCRKCGAAIFTDEDLSQKILDRANEAARRAERCPGRYKAAALSEAAGYRSMYKALMHAISQREYAEAVTPLILKAVVEEIRARNLLAEDEIAALFEKGKAVAAERARAAELHERDVYGEFEAACNRSKPDPTADQAIENVDREAERRQLQ